MKKLIASVLMSMFAASAFAGGYRTSLQGQQALAMGHTGVAVVNSAELAFFNPAGLVHLENRLNVSVSANAIISNGRYQNFQTNESASTDNGTGFAPNAYVTYAITDYLTAGLAVYVPYGSSVSWERDWAGSHLVNDIELASIFIQPLVSVKLGKYLSVGGGPIYATGSVNFNRNLTRTLTDAEGNRSNVTLDDSGISAWGYSIAAMFTPTENFKLGFKYQSEIILDAEGGDADFENIPGIAAQQFPDQQFDASLPLPAELSVGISYEFNDKLLLAFDINRTFWNVYESLDIDFSNEATPDSQNLRNYKNSSIFRFGAQYKVLDMLTLRAGYYYDETPVQPDLFAPETPRVDANGYTGGFSIALGEHFGIDASFLYLSIRETEASYDAYFENGVAAPFRGSYKSNAFIPGLGITYKL